MEVSESQLQSRYERIRDNNVLNAIAHSHSYRPVARQLARKLLLERGLSEEAISQWRDPRAKLFKRSLASGGHTPSRILLLRPFDFHQSRRPTRCFIQRYLSHLGHTYTLSDTEIKPRREVPELISFICAALLLMLTGQFVRFSIPRFAFNVFFDEDIRRLLDFVSKKKIALRFSSVKLCHVICTSEAWLHTVQYLINSMDLIVFDLSRVGDGLKQELVELGFYNAMNKVVFVARDNTISSAQPFFDTYGLSKPNKELFAYGNDGSVTRHEEIKAALASAVRSSVKSNKLSG